MKQISKQTSTKSSAVGKQRSYSEIIEFLDAHWQTNMQDTRLNVMKQLDTAFGSIAKKIKAIFITGSNGKSLTAHFTAKLLKEEGLTVGTFYTPHLLTYNERLVLDNDIISNKLFTELANEVINTAETLKIAPNSYEVLTMISLLHFEANNVDVALLEIGDHPASRAVTICAPAITAITRITADTQEQTETIMEETLKLVDKKTTVVSADQSKLHLQAMQQKVKTKGAQWAMPIRKLAPLNYPFEQLHGRCAALAERIAYIYINEIAHPNAIVVTGTLLTKKKGQRGRPTIEAKRESELNPQKTVDQFWRETESHLPGRFQLLDKEKPTILLDNANNLDAFSNLLLGIRLLHYQKPLKGLTLVLGCNNNDMDMTELLKLLRYFFKKTAGQVMVCPAPETIGEKTGASWDVEKVTNDIKSMKIKAKACKSFKEAFESAQKTVDERNGLLVVTGSSGMITEYWKYKGIKKF